MRKKQDQTLSVIIPTKNRPELLRRVFSSLSGQSPRVDEVVVIDTSDVSFQIKNKIITDAFPSLSICYRLLLHASASRARNYGITCSTGDILAFLDDDSVPEPGWVRAIKKAVTVGQFCFRGQCVDASGSKTIVHSFYTFYKELITRDIKRQWASYGRLKGYQIVDLVQAGNFFVPRDVLTHIHPVFDDNLFPFIAEETDFSLRLRKSGYQILYVPEAKIRHYFLRLGYINFIWYSSFWYGRAAAIFNKRSQHSLDALGQFGQLVTHRIQGKKKTFFWKLLHEGYVLFRNKYAQDTLYNCLFLLICVNYLICLWLGTIYGTFEYDWRLRTHLPRKKA